MMVTVQEPSINREVLSMQKLFKGKVGIAVVLGALFVFLLGICVYAASRQSFPVQENTPIITSTKRHDLDDSVQRVSVNGMLAAYSFPDLIADSSLVIKGRVSEISETFKILWAGEGNSLATDVTVEVLETFRGRAQGGSVTVRMNGGLGSGWIDGELCAYYEDYENEPELFLGETYLLFLHQPNVGGGMNTEGDYYYVSGVSQGVFLTMEAEDVSSHKKLKQNEVNETYFINSSFSLYDEADLSLFHFAVKEDCFGQSSHPDKAILSQGLLPEIMAAADKTMPIEENRQREQLLSAYKGNLERGIITQEEYDAYLAEMDAYAVIVDKDYQEAPDPEAEKQKEELRRKAEEAQASRVALNEKTAS